MTSSVAPPTGVASLPAAGPARRRRGTSIERSPLGVTSGVGLGVVVLWLSLLVLLPLAAVVAKGTGSGWSTFWAAFTSAPALDAIVLTVVCSLVVAAVNAVMGTMIAYVLVRDTFWGKRFIEVLIDIPFALPTIVAGLVLLSLYGSNSPIHVTWYATRPGIVVALLFVTLPFVVRAVQPVLISLERDVEEAAASLGAGSWTTFRRIVLPALSPAIVSGSALAFGRAMGEYGSVILISGGLAHTQVASQYIYGQIENGYLTDAAATATVLLVISVVVIASLGAVQRWAARRG